MEAERLLIRPARPSDARDMHELHTRSVSELCSEDYTEDQITALLSGRTPEGYLSAIERGEMFVAESGSRMVGFGHARQGEVAAVFVDPGSAGQGVGGALVRHAMELAGRDHEGGPIRLKSTLNAVAFYEVHGFVRVERSEIDKRGVTVPVIIMERRGES